MMHFTPERFSPSERTLEFIRQFAYSYRVAFKVQSPSRWAASNPS